MYPSYSSLEVGHISRNVVQQHNYDTHMKGWLHKIILFILYYYKLLSSVMVTVVMVPPPVTSGVSTVSVTVKVSSPSNMLSVNMGTVKHAISLGEETEKVKDEDVVV